MTTELAIVETVECLNCDGQGTTAVRNFGRHVVEEYTDKPCKCCNGRGVVIAEWISDCSNCQTRYWTGDGCAHHNGLCDDCKSSGCRDCRSHA